jgi:undecaprenyl-diphosphatase
MEPELLLTADQKLFLFLNGLHSRWTDGLMYWITFKFTWIPMYVFLIYQIYKNYARKSLFVILPIVGAVALADQITSGLMKPFFARLRPCHDPSIGNLVHLVGGCGGQFGFASSHASTSFALATSCFLISRSTVPKTWLLFVWALVYSYSRIYVGVHYPGDIAVGALVGLLSGSLFAGVYKKSLEPKML